MTVTAPESARTASAAPSQLSLSSGHLPRWAPWALLAVSLLIGFTPFALEAVASGSDLNIAGSVVLGAVIYLVLIYVMSRIVEGSRKALDRLITGIVTSAFAIAMVPLVSVAITVVANGVARFDGLFFSPFDMVFEVVSQEFDTQLADEDLRPFALKIFPELVPYFKKYENEIDEDFQHSAAYQSLYTELTGAIELWIEENGIS